MKSGLNQSDMNAIRRGVDQGWTAQELSKVCRADVQVVQRYIDHLIAKDAPAPKKTRAKKKKATKTEYQDSLVEVTDDGDED